MILVYYKFYRVVQYLLKVTNHSITAVIIVKTRYFTRGFPTLCKMAWFKLQSNFLFLFFVVAFSVACSLKRDYKMIKI